MLAIGDYNKLEALRSTERGMLLSGHETEDVLLVSKQIPEGLKVGDEIEVFVYRNEDDELIATKLSPKILPENFACLKVVGANRGGVYFDMGLEEELWVPTLEQNANVSSGDLRIVFMFQDEKTDKFIGSMKWREFCEEEHNFEENQKVKIMIGERTNLGRNVLIENEYYGLIYANEIFEELEIGDEKEAYVKTLRDDGNIDISLQQPGYGHVKSSSGKILELLEENGGVLDIGDKSRPEKIAAMTGMSKKTFKKAIGDLYKKKLVLLDKEQVRLKE